MQKLANKFLTDNEIKGSIMLLASFLCFFLMLGVWTIHLNSGLPIFWYDVFLVMMLAFLIVSNFYYIVSNNESIIWQNAVLTFAGAMLFGGLVFREDTFDNYWRREYWMSFCGIFVVLSILAMVNCRAYIKTLGMTVNSAKRMLIGKIRNNYCCLGIISGVVGLRLLSGIVQPRWDGAYLFHFLNNVHADEVFSFYRTAFCGHLSQAYCSINIMLGIVFDNLLVGMSFGNMLVFLLGIFSTYKLIKMLFGNMSQYKIGLLTLLYATSPLTLGLLNYNYWDQWVIYLMPTVIYTLCAEKWIFHFFFAAVMCFTKETAVVQYFGLCLGTVCCTKIVNKYSWKQIFSQKRWYGMLCIGTIWMFLYLYLPNWNGNGEFAIDVSYILNKLKVFFALDFLWIYVILAIWGIYCFRQKGITNPLIISILFSEILFITFNCLFKTVNHARYMGGHIICLVLLGIVGLGCLKNLMSYFGIVLVIIQIISNYYTIDPLSKLLFPSYNVGNRSMISTDNEFLSDAMVYNSEYRLLDMALNKALGDSIGEDVVMFFPQIQKDWSWYFDGDYVDYYNEATDGAIVSEYWDSTNEQRVILPDKNAIEFKVCNVSSYEMICRSKIRDGYYYYIHNMDNGIYNELVKHGCVLDVDDYDAHGFVIKRAKISMK